MVYLDKFGDYLYYIVFITLVFKVWSWYPRELQNPFIGVYEVQTIFLIFANYIPFLCLFFHEDHMESSRYNIYDITLN